MAHIISPAYDAGSEGSCSDTWFSGLLKRASPDVEVSAATRKAPRMPPRPGPPAAGDTSKMLAAPAFRDAATMRPAALLLARGRPSPRTMTTFDPLQARRFARFNSWKHCRQVRGIDLASHLVLMQLKRMIVPHNLLQSGHRALQAHLGIDASMSSMSP